MHRLPTPLFLLPLQLTDAGLAAVDEAVAVVYAYLGLLAAHGPQRYGRPRNLTALRAAFVRLPRLPFSSPPDSWVWDECATQAAASFRFQVRAPRAIPPGEVAPPSAA